MTTETNLLTLTADIVASHVEANSVSVAELPALITSVYAALAGLGKVAEPEAEPAKIVGAVTVRKSLASQDHIISMIDGRAYRTLKKHIGKHGMTPVEYRARYNLPADYPMTAPNYSSARSEMARALGLGRKASQTVVKAAKNIETKIEQAVAGKPPSKQ